MKLGVITPVYKPRNPEFLVECLQSVRGQARDAFGELEVFHHVQDGGSSDGTVGILQEWADKTQNTPDYTFTFSSVADDGMYDAINKGFEKLLPHVEWVLHLNSDEQLLPGAAQKILSFSDKADVLLANTAVVGADGRYICSRRPFPPWRHYIRVWIPAQTCASFYSSRFLQRSGVRFNSEWKAVADKQWYIDLFNAGARFRCVDQFTSLFRYASTNLGFSQEMDREKEQCWNRQPAWIRKLTNLFVLHLKARRLWRHLISKKIRELSFYTADGAIKKMVIRDRLRWGIKGWTP